jgi:Zn-dependent M28 family amino/carboxypeptidase
MVGSPNFVRLLYDGDGSDTGGDAGPAGSAAIEAAFAGYFQAQRLPVTKTAFDFRSDYVAFADAGTPVGGVHSGFDARKTAEEAKITVGRQEARTTTVITRHATTSATSTRPFLR